MSIRYLNDTEEFRAFDRANHAHLSIPGEFIVYPSAVRVFATVDPQSEVLQQLLRDPASAPTFYHEHQHLLSLLGTTYGNMELFLLMGQMDKFFEEDGVIQGIVRAGKNILELPRPLISFLCQSPPQWASEQMLKTAQMIEYAERVLEFLQGHYKAAFYLGQGKWPFRRVYSPASLDELLPPKVGMRGPHTGTPNDPLAMGTHLIHEGSARTTEYRILHTFLTDGQVTEEQFKIRDEQAYYQMSRTILYGWFERKALGVPPTQMAYWHALVSDLSLMGPDNMYGLLGGYDLLGVRRSRLQWKDVSPAWRFWNASIAATELARNGVLWDDDALDRQQYVSHANALCDKLGWPSYDELVDIGRRQMELFFELSEGRSGFPNDYYRDLLTAVWECKKISPHLFFNFPKDCPELTDFAVHRIGMSRLLLTKDYIIHSPPEGGIRLDEWQIFYMLHTYSIAKQLLTMRRFDPFKCYQTHFDFPCKHSNGLCGTIPDAVTPADCPFMKWLGVFGINV